LLFPPPRVLPNCTRIYRDSLWRMTCARATPVIRAARSRSSTWERSAQAVAACGGSPAEALPGALGPFRIGDRVWFSRKIVAQDELADSGAFGDAADLGDIGVQRGHPLQGGTGEAVPLE